MNVEEEMVDEKSDQNILSGIFDNSKLGTMNIKKEPSLDYSTSSPFSLDVCTYPSKISVKQDPDIPCQNHLEQNNPVIKQELKPNEHCFPAQINTADLKTELKVDNDDFTSNTGATSDVCGMSRDYLLVKSEDHDQEACEKYELDIQNVQKEIEKCNRENEKANSVQTILENNTTAYRCQMCEAVFLRFPEYKIHKKNHYMEKRRCNICNITLQSIGKLQDHLYKHLNMKPFSCDECGKSFISKHHVKLHQRCHNTEKTFQCTKCEKAFRNIGSLRSHQLVHVERVQEFICKVCNEDCKNLPDFRKHMEAHGKRSEIMCGVCGKTFNSDRGLECHVSTHKELKFPCEYCGKIYPSMYRIKRHIKRAHVPNHCEECKEVFYDRAQYTKHIKQHNASKVAECEYCQKQFDKAKNLSEHIRLQHKQDGEKKKCPICEKEFINSALLKNHVKTHDKCFKCSHCDRLFSSRYNLETHSVTHSGARNHKCSICQKSYSTKSSLKNHMATHSEERLFQCDRCAKTFKTNRRLYVHKISHATEEKYQCEICLQKFRVKQYLKYHMNKHSNNKPFECTICKKRFKHKKSKEKHMVIGKHKFKEDNEHDCDFCDETFTTRDLLLDHFSAVHHSENVINNINECQDGDIDMEEAEEILDVKEKNIGENGISNTVDVENIPNSD